MADFRRWFTVLAVLALIAGAASAQIGTYTPGSATAGALSCTANAAGTPQMRPEGYTELLGDILITCTGGALSTTGQTATQVPTTNIEVIVNANQPITSRLWSSGSAGISEALLLVDDPGSSLITGAVGGYGPAAPQKLCAGQTPTSGGCAAYPGLDNSGGYLVSVTAPGGNIPAANVYQGFLNQAGVNTVTFYGVPVLPPVTTGISRTFRITNLRYPIASLGVGTNVGISVTISTSPSTVLPINNVGNLPVGIVGPAMTASVNPLSNNLPQCVAVDKSAVAVLKFTEGFATAFKTRSVPLSNTAWAAEMANNGVSGGNQNIPGGLYTIFAQNSESGLIFPQATVTRGVTYTAGLADFGTRLKAVFTNIPAGITLYVSGVNSAGTSASNAINSGAATTIGGTSTAVTGVLVGGQSNEIQIDPDAGTGTSPSGGTFPLASTFTPTLIAQSGTYPAIGATAIWEITNSNPAAIDSIYFTVYIGFTPGVPTSTFLYGTPPPSNMPAGAPVPNASLSLAPEPIQAAFSATAANVPGTLPIPRFTILNQYNGPWVTIVLCRTTLLFPFVTANPMGSTVSTIGFDTGIAIANTPSDPFVSLGIPSAPTVKQAGSCTLYPYGNTISATGTLGPNPAAVPGCDTVTGGVPGTTCFPRVDSGTVATVQATSVFPGFQGYMIAVCNFQYAHGYAAVTDLGLRNLFSSYLAIELNKCTPGTDTCCVIGQPRGVSVEYNSH